MTSRQEAEIKFGTSGWRAVIGEGFTLHNVRRLCQALANEITRQGLEKQGVIVGYDRRKGSFIDRDAVVEKFGVEPASIPDWLALVGDAADGFPGSGMPRLVSSWYNVPAVRFVATVDDPAHPGTLTSRLLDDAAAKTPPELIEADLARLDWDAVVDAAGGRPVLAVLGDMIGRAERASVRSPLRYFGGFLVAIARKRR